MRQLVFASMCVFCACGVPEEQTVTVHETESGTAELISPKGPFTQRQVMVKYLSRGGRRTPYVAPQQPQSSVDVSNSMPVMNGSGRYVVAETNTLYLVGTFRFAPGQHTVAFELTDPAGTLYQRFEQTVSVEPANDQVQVVQSLPVAGTWIEQYQMVGTWKVSAFLDDASEAAAQRSFQLE